MNYLEAGMLICFCASWPFDIYKSLKTRSADGKSIVFMFALSAGFIFGVTNKIINDPRDIVLVLYIINFLMVSVDIYLFYRIWRLKSRLRKAIYRKY